VGVDSLNIKGLKELEHAGPIVMVNLMRFTIARSMATAAAGMPTCATARSPCR